MQLLAMRTSFLAFAIYSAVGFGLAAMASAQKISIGKKYAYFKTVPGQAAIYYFDNASVHGAHDVHTVGLGAYDLGELTDGTLSSNVGIRGVAANAPPADIIIDLGGVTFVGDCVLGTPVVASLNNNAPDDVTVSYSITGTAPNDFFSAQFYDMEAMYGPLADGHHDLLLKGSGTVARYVKLEFDGGSMAEPGGSDPDEKWMLDEISIYGPQCPAFAYRYGKGLPGQLGIPTLTASALPKFGANISLLASNSSATATQCMVLLGISRASIPFLGGKLLTVPIVLSGLPMPAAGLTLPVTIPTGNCLASAYLQVLQLDAAAAFGVSMSPGLRLDPGY
ncbi:MAG: hypothetical protein VX951_12765 [Planctomycetota bacterium]|nr:hypothetical protein [Planctomycetota bacterium]